MLIAAVIDAGVPVARLNESLAGLKPKGLSISCQTGRRGGVRGTLVSVGRKHQTGSPLRPQDFVSIVQESSLPSKVVERSCAIFRRLGEAEAAVHGVPEDEVQLHELGDVDTLVDVVGGVLGLDILGIERLYSSPIPSGSGLIPSEHGMLPAPAPATARLLAMAKAPVVAPPGNVPDAGEMVTPTGAAIVTTLATFGQPAMDLEMIGYGLGARESPHYPNVLALWIGEEAGVSYVANLSLIESNIDDMSPELLAYVQERLFDLGARDVWFSPIQMKKNRPATILSALVPAELESGAVMLVMRETSSLGVRVRPVARYEAEREIVQVDTSLGTVHVKVKRLAGANVAVSPEYEECRRIAVDRAMPLQDVYRIVQGEASQKLL
jgi:uncharacterized protein (TIGR00299 family) protein